MTFKDNSSIIQTKASLDPEKNVILALILFIVVYTLGAMLGNFVLYFLTYFIMFFRLGSQLDEGLYTDSDVMISPDGDTLISLFSLIGSIIAVYLLARKYYGVSQLALGLDRKNLVRDYLLGALIGLASISLIVAILVITGQARIQANLSQASMAYIILYILAWMVQGFAEEFLSRSAMMNFLAARYSIGLAIVVNSFFFALLHIANDNLSLLAILNLFLAGLMFSLLFYLSETIWLPAAYHSFWNMAQGNVFGSPVSGTPVSQHSFFLMTFPKDSILNGGAFGIEGAWLKQPFL